MLLAEERLGVAQKQHLIALDTINLAPRIHNPRVIAGNSRHDIYALLTELVGVLDVGREMVCLAAGGEGAGDAEEDDFLVRPFFAGVVLLGAAAGGGVRVGDGRPSN